MSSYRTTGGETSDLNNPTAGGGGGDDTSLRSLPIVSIHPGLASTQVSQKQEQKHKKAIPWSAQPSYADNN